MPALTALRLATARLALGSSDARADAINDWNQKTHAFIAEARLGTPPASVPRRKCWRAAPTTVPLPPRVVAR